MCIAQSARFCNELPASKGSSGGAPIQQHRCMGCGSALPLQAVKDHIRGTNRVMTHDCTACGYTHVAQFRLVGGAWELVGSVQRSKPAKTRRLSPVETIA